MNDVSGDGRELPGFKKKSFSMPFGGGDIWFEHLDGIYGHTDLVIEKLTSYSLRFLRPSMPSLIAVNLDETVITPDLILSLVQYLKNGNKRFTRVAFVGVDRKSRSKLKEYLSFS